MHSNWRDCKAWQLENLPLSTTSNEACKMYDAALTQIVSFQENENLGGLAGTFKKLNEADPNFVLGKTLVAYYSNYGSIRTNPDFKKAIIEVDELAYRTQLTEREKNYVEAIKALADGQISKGVQFLEDILLDHPTDIWALKLAQFNYLMQGSQKQMRDSVARVLPFWKSDMPLYGYIHGMYAFGLIETGNYVLAEKEGLKGLDINSKDIWAAHAVCHSYEMTGQPKRGVAFAENYSNNWAECNLFACHNFWHLALFHINNGDYDSALAVYDNEIGQRALVKPASIFKISDAASLLRRLEFEGVNVGTRWKELYQVSESILEIESGYFFDAHNYCVCLGAKEKDAAKKMTQSIKNLMSGIFFNCFCFMLL